MDPKVYCRRASNCGSVWQVKSPGNTTLKGLADQKTTQTCQAKNVVYQFIHLEHDQRQSILTVSQMTSAIGANDITKIYFHQKHRRGPSKVKSHDMNRMKVRDGTHMSKLDKQISGRKNHPICVASWVFKVLSHSHHLPFGSVQNVVLISPHASVTR